MLEAIGTLLIGEYHFSDEQFAPFVLGLFFLVAALFLHNKHEKPSIFLLVLGGFTMALFSALLDPFLVLWDEQYHALVAKHLVEHPFVPTLYENPVMAYGIEDWTGNHIWLHKQPFFLWMMASSIKIFGATTWAARLPSVVFFAGLIFLSYRTSRIITNKQIAVWSAVILSCCYFPLSLVAGRSATDHNDMAFLFLVTGSFWAWLEYNKNRKQHWYWLVSIFVGLAVLTKWLTGGMVYIAWFSVLLFTKDSFSEKKKEFIQLVKSGLVSILIFMPWQIYCLVVFPEEFKQEMFLNSAHFTTAVEGHAHHLWYHFVEGRMLLYGSGDIIPALLIAGLVTLFFAMQSKTHRVFVGTVLCFTYGFFTLAATKMPAFTVITMPFVVLGIASLIQIMVRLLGKLVKQTQWQLFMGNIIIILVSIAFANLPKAQTYHTDWKPHDNHDRAKELADLDWFEKMKQDFDTDQDLVFFNVNHTVNSHIAMMYYTSYIAYPFCPAEKEVIDLQRQGYKVAIVSNEKCQQSIYPASVKWVSPPSQKVS
jgi:4-amino-4-deoxy-L-arabinose transferase